MSTTGPFEGRVCPGGTMLVSDIVAEGLPQELMQISHLYSSCLTGAICEEAYLDGLRSAGLVEVQVQDRLVYDISQLEAFIGSELQEAGSSCCGSGNISGELVAKPAPGSVFVPIYIFIPIHYYCIVLI